MLTPRVPQQGTAMLFHPHAFPYGAIGPVRFLWRAAKEEGGLRDVLVWLHPACATEAVAALREATVTTRFEGGCSDSDEGEEVQLAVTVHVLLLSLVRFSLVGPLSTQVLHRALQPRGGSPGAALWAALHGLPSPGAVAAGAVVAFEAMDPRVRPVAPHSAAGGLDAGAPGARDSSVAATARLNDALVDWPRGACEHDAIWSCLHGPGKDGNRAGDMPTDAQVNAARHAAKTQLFDLTSDALPDVEASVGSGPYPCLVIQTPGLQSGHGSGWDVVLPASCANPCWLAAVYAGARAVRGGCAVVAISRCGSTDPRDWWVVSSAFNTVWHRGAERRRHGLWWTEVRHGYTARARDVR